MTDAQARNFPSFTEYRISGGNGDLLYVREFAGDGPAFVLMHGLPAYSHIYDDLIPHLVTAGCRTVAFDSLGLGDSDKPKDATYSFQQQLEDLEAVVNALRLDQVILIGLIGHDAGGPAAIYFAFRHPDRTAFVCLINAFYGEAPDLRVSELIELFATKNLKAFAQHFLASPQQFAWLLNFQREQMQAELSEAKKARYNSFLGPTTDNNFTKQSSAGPAFAQLMGFEQVSFRINQLHVQRESVITEAFMTFEARHPLLAEMLKHRVGNGKRAAQWMCSHQRAFGGKTGYDIIAEGDTDSVWDEVQRLG